MKNIVDLIIKTMHMYTLEGEGLGYKYNYSIVIDDGKIICIDSHEKVDNIYTAKKNMCAESKLVLPGLIDGHMHTQHAIIRGVAQDINNWMMHGVGPFEENKTKYSKKLGSTLAIYEAVLNGTTTIGDDGYEMEDVCDIIDRVGVRGNISVRIRDAVTKVYEPGEIYEYDESIGAAHIDEFRRLHQKWNGYDEDRILINIGPQGPDFVSKENLIKVKKVSKEFNTKIHMHLQQGSRETQQMKKRYGRRSIEWLNEMDYFDQDFIGIHLTDATDEEAQFLAKCNSSMVLCSGSIGIIDGIVPPANAFRSVNGNVGLGSDQAPGNNCHNIINEMKLTALFNKIKFEDPEIMPAYEVLKMATIGGAKALGIDHITGSLEVGKSADLIMIDLNSLSMQPILTIPMRNFIPNLVYSANGSEVDTVIVAGKVIVKDKKPVTFNPSDLVELLKEEAEVVGKKSVDKFLKIDGKNAQYMREDKL